MTDEELANVIARAREQMIAQVRHVYLETLDHLIRVNMLPMSTNTREAQALAATVAAAAVTAAQLMSDRTAAGIAKRFQAMDERLKVLEAAGAQVKELADQLTDALARLGTPTREEFARISHEVFGVEKPGVVVGEPTPSMLAKMGINTRRAVPLQPSELQADFVYAGGLQPPEGMRWESDDELRARLKARTPLPRLDIVCDHKGGDEYSCAVCKPPEAP